jgi:hypothetical protein
LLFLPPSIDQAFIQTQDAIPNELLTQFDDDDMFRDWSDEFRALDPADHSYTPW